MDIITLRDVEIMLACAGGLDHTSSAARPSDLGLSQHHQGIPRKGPEDSGDEKSPHTVSGTTGLLQSLQSAAVGRAESTPLAGIPLLLFIFLTFSRIFSHFLTFSHIFLYLICVGHYLGDKLCTFPQHMLEDEGLQQISKTM